LAHEQILSEHAPGENRRGLPARSSRWVRPP
jgi:hypothetical protein